MTTSIRSLCILAGFATAPVAWAQTIEFTIDGDPRPGSTVTIGMRAHFDSVADYAMAGIGTSVLVNEAQGEFSDLRLVKPMDGPGTRPGTIGPSSLDGIIAGQIHFHMPDSKADPTNPMAFWEADFTIDDTLQGSTILDIESVTSRFDVYLDYDTGTSESRLDDLVEGELRIVIPAPAGTFVLIGGLILASRRRR